MDFPKRTHRNFLLNCVFQFYINYTDITKIVRRPISVKFCWTQNVQIYTTEWPRTHTSTVLINVELLLNHFAHFFSSKIRLLSKRCLSPSVSLLCHKYLIASTRWNVHAAARLTGILIKTLSLHCGQFNLPKTPSISLDRCNLHRQRGYCARPEFLPL